MRNPVAVGGVGGTVVVDGQRLRAKQPPAGLVHAAVSCRPVGPPPAKAPPTLDGVRASMVQPEARGAAAASVAISEVHKFPGLLPPATAEHIAGL